MFTSNNYYGVPGKRYRLETVREYTNTRRSRTLAWCSKVFRKKKVVVCFVVISVLVLCLLAGLGFRYWKGKHDSTGNEYTSKLTGGQGNVPGVTSDSNALLINHDVCDKGTCFECEATVFVKYNPYEPMWCELSNRNIKNATCYLCNNTCLTAENISRFGEEKKMVNCVNNAAVDINCCLIAQMKNLEKRIVEGRYNCYEESVHKKYGKSAIRPLFQCSQFGRKGERCDELYTETFICKCFQYKNKFPGQDKLSECNKEPRTSNMSVCYMPGERHNCLCRRRNDTQSGNMASCDSPHPGAVTSCASSFNSLPVGLCLTLLLSYLTDLGIILGGMWY